MSDLSTIPLADLIAEAMKRPKGLGSMLKAIADTNLDFIAAGSREECEMDRGKERLFVRFWKYCTGDHDARHKRVKWLWYKIIKDLEEHDNEHFPGKNHKRRRAMLVTGRGRPEER